MVSIIALCPIVAMYFDAKLGESLCKLTDTVCFPKVTSSLNFFTRTTADVETNMVAVERIKEYTEVVQVCNGYSK
jgi:heterodisulfide reductase subunit B